MREVPDDPLRGSPVVRFGAQACCAAQQSEMVAEVVQLTRLVNLFMDSNRSSQEAYLHLLSDACSADLIAQLLPRLGCDDPVLGMCGVLADGPLCDVETGGASTLAWWSKVHGAPLEPEHVRDLVDDDRWATVRRSGSNVMVWHGPHPAERLFALRVCWQLRAQPERVFEVAIAATGETWRRRPRPAFYDAAGLLDVETSKLAWGRRAKVEDVAARARRWEELCSRTGEWIRVLDGEEIVHLPTSAYDEELVRACSASAWTSSRKVVCSVLAENPTGTALLGWRVRELLGRGVLEGRGSKSDFDDSLPSELRVIGSIS